MKTLLGNSAMPNYVKITATALLALTYVSALVVAIVAYIEHETVPSEVWLVLGTGIGFASNAIGLHTGASLAESNPQAIAANTTSTTTQSNVTKETNNASTPTT